MKRGEIWLIDLGIVQKARPCLILSVEFLDHERAVVTYVPEPRNSGRLDSRCLTAHQVLRPAPLMLKVSVVFL